MRLGSYLVQNAELEYKVGKILIVLPVRLVNIRKAIWYLRKRQMRKKSTFTIDNALVPFRVIVIAVMNIE